MGAGCQCGDPTFCPLSVFCPLFDHLLSTYCPQFALVLSLSSLCLLFIHQIPTFVYPSSSFCPPCPLFGLTLSTLLTQILEKSTGQKLVKKWTHFLVNLPPGHPVTGQNLDNYKTLLSLKLVHLLPRYHTPHQNVALVMVVGQQFLSTFCPLSRICPLSIPGLSSS